MRGHAAAGTEHAAACLNGGGEMGARMRAFDWAPTPLGTVDTWSQSLRTAVGMAINSRYPMFVWWGPHLINLYNDAYIPMLGARHPVALGTSAPSVWAEITASIADDLTGLRLLVVKDMDDAREATAAMLRRPGAEVLTARDGLEALTIARGVPIDIVLCDLRMPRMDGYEVPRTPARSTWRGTSCDRRVGAATLGRHSGLPTHIPPTRRGPRVPDRQVRGLRRNS